MRFPIARAVAVAAVALLALGSLPGSASAQGEPVEPRPMLRGSAAALEDARRRAGSGDTAGAIAVYREAAARDPENGVLWFEYGALLAARTYQYRRQGSMPTGVPQMMIVADSAMARAVRLLPDSVTYAITYGKFLFETNVFSVSRAERYQKGAIEKLSDGRDSAKLAEAADYVGTMQWRRFEPLIARSNPSWMPPLPPRQLSRAGFIQYIRENNPMPTTMYGLALYEDALSYYRLAARADPANERYFRHVMMVLAERNRWGEIEDAARTRIAQYPAQPWGWLALGLAQQRLSVTNEAKRSLDSGFARLSSADRSRLRSIANVIPPARQRWYDSLSGAQRAALHTVFWNTANPSLLLPANAIETEFLARVVYAELRWTDEQRGTPGANTNKAEIYVRYGPPDIIVDWLVNQAHLPRIGRPQTWAYYRELMVFTFEQNDGYGFAYHTPGSMETFDSVAIERPAAWSNIPVLRHSVDSASAQVARFRAGTDSMDVAVFAGFRPGQLRSDVEIGEGRMLYGAFALDAMGGVLAKRVDSAVTAERDTNALLGRDYFLRVPLSTSALRVEALEPSLLRAARAVVDVNGFRSSGFALSDLLVADRVTRPASGEPRRWSDYAVAPLIGRVARRDAPISLLWETYEPAAAGGRSRLRIAITVQRETSGGLRSIAGRVIGGVREAMGSSRGTSQTITYEREVSATPLLVDDLQLDLGRLEPGSYRITITVTDLVANRSASRAQRFAIARR